VDFMEKDGGTEMELGKLRILGKMREDVEDVRQSIFFFRF
jgi:hypothetical protein